jgi:guanylate kinase
MSKTLSRYTARLCSSSVMSRRPVVPSASLLVADHRSFWGASANQGESEVLDPLVVCGPSGVGKGTIIDRYMRGSNNDDEIGRNRTDIPFAFTVSHTTRQPRPGEVNGVHYHFVSHQEMSRLIQEDAFLEHAEVHGNFYGTSWASLKAIHNDESMRRRALLDIDVNGVLSLKALEYSLVHHDAMLLQPRYIFIAPPDLETLKLRLQARGTESLDSLEKRTASASLELEYGLSPRTFDAIVYNHDIDQAVADFSKAVQELYGV